MVITKQQVDGKSYEQPNELHAHAHTHTHTHNPSVTGRCIHIDIH